MGQVNLSPYAAELIGTLVLVFFGTMAASIYLVILEAQAGVAWLAIGAAHGIALLIMYYAISRISGCHINPAVTIGMLALRKIGAKRAVGYIIFQLIGAAAASGLHAAMLPQGAAIFFGMTLPATSLGITATAAVAIEAVITFFLMFVILNAVMNSKTDTPGIALGLTLGAIVAIAGPLTGAAANPARAFGPALASSSFAFQWVYWAGPIIGALVAVAVFKIFFDPKRK